MEKCIDKIIINCGDNVVTVKTQMYLKRTDNPQNALVVFDRKSQQYICNIGGHKLSPTRYILYESGSENFSSNNLDIAPFVEELNQKKVVPNDNIVMEIENKMFNEWYEDYALQNHLLPLREIERLVRENNEKNGSGIYA